jgi:ribose 5-phosphate isomerase B
MIKRIYLGADHAGFELKEKIKKWLIRKGIPYGDLGNQELNPNDDYPDYAIKVARRSVREKTLGILFCGSAQGMCIAANKIKGAKAVVPFSIKEARLAREHNDANVLCLSGWYYHFHKATKLIDTFIDTKFSKAERHVRRLKKIEALKR